MKSVAAIYTVPIEQCYYADARRELSSLLDGTLTWYQGIILFSRITYKQILLATPKPLSLLYSDVRTNSDLGNNPPLSFLKIL
jgi:hypothetical protein